MSVRSRIDGCISIQYDRLMAAPRRPNVRIGRGAVSNPEGRFETTRAEVVDDGWGTIDEPLPPLATSLDMTFSAFSKRPYFISS